MNFLIIATPKPERSSLYQGDLQLLIRPHFSTTIGITPTIFSFYK